MIRGDGAFAAPSTWQADGFKVALWRGLTPEREQWERSLLRTGRMLPLPHRSSWAALQPPARDDLFLAISDATGRPCGAVALQVTPSRALPG
ncbi:MAG: hypothetical protein ACREMI_07770, partial [Gemmatimonadales bacterium]